MVDQPRTFFFRKSQFNPVFLPYLEAPHFIQLFVGNRGSGKSTFNYERALILALNREYFRLVYCRKIANTIRKSIFQGFKDLIYKWKLQDDFTIKEGEMDIICNHNNNMLVSFGLDNPEKLKGINDPTHVLFDEMTEGTFDDYAQLIALLRTTKVKYPQFWGCFNPEYDFWGRNYFFLDSESDTIPMGEVPAKTNNTLIFKASFRDNPFINAKEYEKNLLELARNDQNYMTVWIDGDWGQAVTGNEYFTEFNRAIHVTKVPFIKGKPVHLTYDFNVVPFMTELCYQVNITASEFQIRLFKEYCLKSPHNSTLAVGKAFLSDYEQYLIDLLYYGDATANNRIAGKGNETGYDDVEKIFYKWLSSSSKRVLKRNPSVLKRRDFMNDLFSGKLTYNGLRVVFMIDESCTETIEDFSKLKLGIDGKMKERTMDKQAGITYEKRGHPSDASEYFIIRLLWDVFDKD